LSHKNQAIKEDADLSSGKEEKGAVPAGIGGAVNERESKYIQRMEK
jgi:hypothetical protein